jgi:hypothetical protein
MSERWTSYPHLRAKLVVGFLAGAAFVALLSFFIVGRVETRTDQPGAGLTALDTLLGWCVVFPFIVLFRVRRDQAAHAERGELNATLLVAGS